jgi:hypothetical protein
MMGTLRPREIMDLAGWQAVQALLRRGVGLEEQDQERDTLQARV